MARKDAIEETTKRISQLRLSQPPPPEAREELAKYLANKSNLIVSKAAEALPTLGFKDLTGSMEEAFARFMIVEDKGCLAKTAIIKALNQMALGSENLFLCGVRHVQLEASWGQPVDVAGELRATSGLALAAMGSLHALTELTDLLMDPLPECRLAAARGLAHIGHESGALPLRVKLLARDPEMEVVEECLAALVRLTPKKAIGFIERMLDDADEDRSSAAARALGMTREPAALELLLARWKRDINPEVRRRLLPGIAAARLPEAVHFLIELIEDAHRSVAVETIELLKPYRHDAQIRSRVAAAVEGRRESEVRSAFEAIFGS